jgi:integrase
METKVTVEAFLQSRKAKGLSKRTIQWYQNILLKFLAMFPEMPDSPTAIEEFLISCRGGDERRHGYFRTIRVFYRFACRRYKTNNPVNSIEAPKRRKKYPRPITLDQLSQLLSFPHSQRVMAVLTFLAESGARIGELANLNKEDIFISEWGPLARITGKTGERIIPVSENTYNMLQTILPLNVKVDQLTRIVSWAFRDAHVPGTAHCLRHTFGTYWDGEDMDLQNIMGHSDLATTKRYRSIRLKKICEQHRKFNPLTLISTNQQLK